MQNVATEWTKTSHSHLKLTRQKVKSSPIVVGHCTEFTPGQGERTPGWAGCNTSEATGDDSRRLGRKRKHGEIRTVVGDTLSSLSGSLGGRAHHLKFAPFLSSSELSRATVSVKVLSRPH